MPDTNIVDDKARVDITSVNDGKDCIIDPMAVKLYGFIYASEVWDNVSSPAILLNKAYEYLAAHKLLQISLELTAIDLHLLNVDVSPLRIGDTVPVESQPHDIDDDMVITKLEIDPSKPDGTTVTLGSKRTSLIDESTKRMAETADIVKRSTQANYATNKQVTEVVLASTADISSRIDQTASQIMLSVSESYATKTNLAETETRMDSSLALTADEMRVNFESVSAYAKNIDGQLSQYQKDIATWIRFSIDGMDMGKTDSPFTSHLDNTQLSFRQNGQDVAYITNNKMFITDAEITNSLAIGKFAYIPRANGNTSFTWIGGAA